MWGSSLVLRAFPTPFIPLLTRDLRLPGEGGEDRSSRSVLRTLVSPFQGAGGAERLAVA